MGLRIEQDAEPIPGYRLVERVGGGGFGEVWKAIAPGGLHKAVKIIHGNLQSTEEEGSRLAAQELKAIKRVQAIRHPYLLSLERYDIVDGRLVIVMELADCNLWDRFRECRVAGMPGIPRAELLQYMQETSEVLDMMNNQYALQHLDVKPQNLFLIYNHIKVADFGLVKDLEGMRAEVTGGVTPVYAAPETFDGIVTRFCDQYSLAIVYQELLTGVRPFNGTTAQQLLMQHLQGTPNVSPLPAAERSIVARALAKKPEDRFASCLHFVKALQQLGGVPAPNDASTYAAPAARVETPAGRAGGVSFQSASPPPETPRTEFRVRHDSLPSMASVSVEFMPQRVAPPEIQGDGPLQPTLVIGLGQTGTAALQRFRHQVQEWFGPIEKIPTLRLTYIDTDSEALSAAQQSDASPAILTEEIVCTRLNRAAHYLKPRRNGRSLIEGWCDPQLLYRIPRSPETLGIRAFGRLAFLDHYRSIVGKVREDLDAVTNPDALANACRQTGLSYRSNRPRVFVVTHLGGGTGSGMFLDVAFALRHKLRQLGYNSPDITGIFLVPTLDRAQQRASQLIANTYAALRELNHFSKPETVFQTQYDEKDGTVNDPGSPYSRVVILPTLPVPERAKSPRLDESVEPAAELLFRETLTPWGREADQARAELPPLPNFQLSVQTFASASFLWPRRAITANVVRWLADTLLFRWVSPDTGPLKEPVKTWLASRWESDQCGPESVIGALQRACEKELGQNPDTIFVQEATPYIPKGWFAREPESTKLWATLEKLQQIVGTPDERALQRQAGRLEAVFSRQAESLTRDLGARVCKIPRALLEHPDYRVTGAEEAVHQLYATVTGLAEQYDGLATELGDKASDAYYLLLYFLSGETGRKRPSVAEVAENLKLYPKWRYQSLTLRHVSRVYQGIALQLKDLLNEIHYCRERLEELVLRYRARRAEKSCEAERELLPAGCESFEQAVRSLRKSITPEDLSHIDQQIQGFIEAEFQALFSVCLSSMSMIGNLEATIDRQAKVFVQSRLQRPDFVEMLLHKFQTPEQATQAIQQAFQRAMPTLARVGNADVGQLNLLGLPPSPHQEWLEQTLQRSMGREALRLTTTEDRILLYREFARLPLVDLPQVGPMAEEVYRAALENPSCPPHCRSDIPEWHDVEVG